jgi:hypothetical protein
MLLNFRSALLPPNCQSRRALLRVSAKHKGEKHHENE